jgi:predicted DNA-binding helix-hairpin-helix protein
VNLEAPNSRRVQMLSRAKDFDRGLLAPLRTAHRLRQKQRDPVSMTTQFVVGAADESDHEILETTDRLYGDLQLARAYFSAFQPVPGTPLEGHPATPTWREHRLYQADFLLRQYGFAFRDLVFDEAGNLPSQQDPKTVWALHHPERFPVEVNTASREELLRIPGVGPRGAATILGRRRQAGLRQLGHLGLTAALARRAAPFVLMGGTRPDFQPALWTSERAAADARPG